MVGMAEFPMQLLYSSWNFLFCSIKSVSDNNMSKDMWKKLPEVIFCIQVLLLRSKVLAG